MTIATLLPTMTGADIMEEFERSGWRVPEGGIGKIVDTLAELQQLLPADERWSEVIKRESIEGKKLFGLQRAHGFVRYAREDLGLGGTYYVAYGCNSCNKIVVDVPKLEPTSTKALLAGRESLDYSCGNCGALLYEKIGKQY
jgi:hypothetical protein